MHASFDLQRSKTEEEVQDIFNLQNAVKSATVSDRVKERVTVCKSVLTGNVNAS
jgi:hypothetical protein